MFDLNKIYDKLPLPVNQNPNFYSAMAIRGYDNHRIGKNYKNEPSLLIFISEKDQDFLIAKQSLFNIKISHNLNCEIESGDDIVHRNFSVISYTGQSNDVKELFLNTCEVLVKSLGPKPSNKKIKNIVEKFIELFKAIKEVPKKSLQGLWAELFLIEQSKNPEYLIDGWHIIPEEKFDFSFGSMRLEVKSSATESRIHHFSAGQLNPKKETEINVVSILVAINAGGISLSELFEKVNKKLKNFQKQKEKLHLLVYSTLGIDLEKSSQVKFDYELAKDSLKFFSSADIPKIEIQDIPKEVSNVRFVSNLINSKSIDVNIDELIAPHRG